MKIIYLGTLFILTLPLSLLALIDLEDMAQDLVMSVQQIIIPEYPHAFNPSIVRWKNSLLLSFRVIPDPAHSFSSWIGLVWLDENFKPRGKPYKLFMRSDESLAPPRLEDGRLITVGDHLYLVYSDNPEQYISKGGFRMYVAELHFDGKKFRVKNNERLSSFEGNKKNQREKNWVPFDYEGSLLLAYSLTPHRIFYPLLDGSEHCESCAFSKSLITWSWGALRGGTPALLDDGHYLAFFHSSKRMVTAHSAGKEANHYFIGAYTFSCTFPFTITRMSKQPIIGKRFYEGKEYAPYWGPVRVVFPCGFIMDNKYIWITYGRQDHEMWIAQLDKKKLYASLAPVPTMAS